VARDWYALGLLASALVSGCSGSSGVDAAEAADAAPAPQAARPAKATVRVASADPTTAADSLERTREIEVMRETFTYQGGARDPFNSLVTGLSTGPELADLQLVGIYEDMRTPSNSVVVLREKKQDGKRYKLRAGDHLGRIRLAQIRPREAVFMIQDLGFERQETLSLRKQEEATP
jgi:hypothetical protein